MKNFLGCITLLSIVACQANHPTVTAPLAPEPASNEPTSNNTPRVTPKLVLKHYLELTEEAKATLADEQSRVNDDGKGFDKEANARLIQAFDPSSLRLALGANGKFEMTIDYTTPVRTTKLALEATGNPLTGAFSASADQLGVNINITCLPLSATQVCDPRDNALVTFKGLDSFPAFKNARVSILFQTTTVGGDYSGIFRRGPFGFEPRSFPLEGKLLVIVGLNEFDLIPEQALIEVTSTYGTLLIAGRDDLLKPQSILWTLDRKNSQDANVSKYELAAPSVETGSAKLHLSIKMIEHSYELGKSDKNLDLILGRNLL